MEQPEPIAEESSQARWTKIIEEHGQSGLPVSVFCRERSVSVASYYSWRRKLGGEQNKAGFVEARVVDGGGDHRKLVCIEGGWNAAGVRIELAGGRRVVVSRGFDRRLLLEVIGLLEQTAGVTGATS